MTPIDASAVAELVRQLRLFAEYADFHVASSAAVLIEQQSTRLKELERDAARYRRLRENWLDCPELSLHGRLAVVDWCVDYFLLQDAALADSASAKASAGAAGREP
jgi:hypothetical protein